MLKNFSEGMILSEEKNDRETLTVDGTAPLDIAAAVSLKNVFSFFSLAFRYPWEAVHEELGCMLLQFDDFLNAYAGNAPDLPQVVDLQAEYIRLFVSGRDGEPAVYYPACHLNRRFQKGESYHRLCQIMDMTGFMADKSVGELEGHLVVLLEFCAMLTDRLIEASNPGGTPLDETMNIFGEVTARYLRPLAKAILAGVSKCTVMDFYGASTRALYNFLADVEKIYEHVFGVSVVAARKKEMKRQYPLADNEVTR